MTVLMTRRNIPLFALILVNKVRPCPPGDIRRLSLLSDMLHDLDLDEMSDQFPVRIRYSTNFSLMLGSVNSPGFIVTLRRTTALTLASLELMARFTGTTA